MTTRATYCGVLLGCLLLSGCFRTTIRSGKPAAPTTVENHERWHHGFVFGMGEFSGPYRLDQACPEGWAEIKTETSASNFFVDAVTGGMYTPQTVSIRCRTQAPPRGAELEQGVKP